MFTFQTEPQRDDAIAADTTKRIRTRSELYKLLEGGFGQSIANRMSSSIVNTLEAARATLSKFQS